MVRKKDIVNGFSFTVKEDGYVYSVHVVSPPGTPRPVMYIKSYGGVCISFKFATRGLSLYTFCGGIEIKGFIMYDDIIPILKPVTL